VEQANAVVLVTVDDAGRILDRRQVVLTALGLPTHPHHHEGSWAVGRYLNTPGARLVSLEEAVALVERVRASAAKGASAALDAIAATVAMPVVGIALRAIPELPASTEERIRDHQAQTCADSAMYREELAGAAAARGWAITWYDRDRVASDAERSVAPLGLDAVLGAMGRACGPPWQSRHKLAATAALAALRRHTLSSSSHRTA
jgi:hypothetical protein